MATETAPKTPIIFPDGRIVEFGAKQRLNKETSIEAGKVLVRLDFRNGRSLDFTIPDEMLLQFAGHGAEQKLGDAIAGETDLDDAVVAVEDLISRLNAGDWTVKRASGGFAGTSVLIQALVEASGKTVEQIKSWLENKTQAEKLALRRSDKLAPIVARIESEKASKSKSTIDTSALLGEIDSIGEDAAPATKSRKAKEVEPAE